jgi:hypothetical protein
VRYRLKLYFWEQIELPLTQFSKTDIVSGRTTSKQLSRDHIEFDAASVHFRVSQSTEGFDVDVGSDIPFPSSFAMRIVEALRFVLALPVKWRLIVTQTSGEEYWRPSSEKKLAAQQHWNDRCHAIL